MIKLSIICNLYHLIIFSSYFNKYVSCDDNQINDNNNDDDDNGNHNSVITFPDLTTLQCDLIIKKHSKIHGVGIYAGRNYKRGEVVERCISVSIPQDKGMLVSYESYSTCCHCICIYLYILIYIYRFIYILYVYISSLIIIHHHHQ